MDIAVHLPDEPDKWAKDYDLPPRVCYLRAVSALAEVGRPGGAGRSQGRRRSAASGRARTAARRAHRLKIRAKPRPQPRSLKNKLSLGINVGLDRGRLSRAGSAVTLEVPRPGRRCLRGAYSVNTTETAPPKPGYRAGTPVIARKMAQGSQQYQGHLLTGSGHSGRRGSGAGAGLPHALTRPAASGQQARRLRVVVHGGFLQSVGWPGGRDDGSSTVPCMRVAITAGEMGSPDVPALPCSDPGPGKRAHRSCCLR